MVGWIEMLSMYIEIRYYYYYVYLLHVYDKYQNPLKVVITFVVVDLDIVSVDDEGSQRLPQYAVVFVVKQG